MKLQRIARLSVVGIGCVAGSAAAQKPVQVKPVAPQPEVKHHEPPRVDGGATVVEVPDFRGQFGPDRQPQGGFSLQDQLETYRKAPVATQEPFYLWGREMYASGPLREYPNVFGNMNPTQPHLMVYGDARTAVGFSDNGDIERAPLATRLNVDFDLKLTATERVHAFVRPFDKNGRIMSADIGGEDGNEDEFVLDGNLDTLFFEGDIGPIVQGASGRPNNLDLPIAFGKMPLLFQNGVWLEDAFTGVATTIQAKNSGVLDIANADFTFFAGFDDVSSAAVKDAKLRGGQTPSEGGTKIVGVAGFVETREGYAEFGLGITQAEEVNGAAEDDADYLNVTAAWTKRYWHWLSNSVRVISNVGQDLEGSETADGVLLLVENSFGTKQPYTLIPYFNLFVGMNSPQSLARAADAGGVLKNTGINFETDGLTGHPKLDDTGHDAWGAALGVEYLPNLFTAAHRQQIVLELAGLHPFGDDATAQGDEFAFGARYQFVIDNSWILRADAMLGWREEDDELAGFRVEIRKKF
ncbi:MAG: hypothetical protein IT454_07975 [Planctomycetes bacterium]|nr:hypothetical protein [Planctomycetota bacterium]